MFLWETKWTRVPFYKSQISKSTWVGSGTLKNLNPNQTSLKWFHPQFLVHLWLRAIQDKHLICEKCDSIEGNIYHPTDVPKNLSKTWHAPKQKKNNKIPSPQSKLSPSEDKWNSWINLQTKIRPRVPNLSVGKVRREEIWGLWGFRILYFFTHKLK